MNRTYNKTIRYSPSMPAAYAGFSPYLQDPQAWNLAFLSFPYEQQVYPPRVDFNVLVRRTAQSKLDGSGPDLSSDCSEKHVVGHMLAMPAPRFVYLIKDHAVLRALPLFQSFGQDWLDVIAKRSWVCVTEPPRDDYVISEEAKRMAADTVRKARQP